MITIEIFDDGSALKTWVSRDGEHINHTEMPPEEVVEILKTPCANNTGGCGMCLACKVREAVLLKLKADLNRKTTGEHNESRKS